MKNLTQFLISINHLTDESKLVEINTYINSRVMYKPDGKCVVQL